MNQILSVKNLVIKFPLQEKSSSFIKNNIYINAVNGISFTINKGETLGLVGESGCGKTSTLRAIMQLIKPDSGQILFKGDDLAKLSAVKLQKIRKDFQMIFQDPFTSLNPKMSVSSILKEPSIIHQNFKKNELDDLVDSLLIQVGLNIDIKRRKPHQLSGGQRQRVGIAKAISLKPKLLVCDEPLSSLDVSVQAQIFNLLMELKETNNLTILFVSHDLNVVRHFADKIAIMYLGKLLEIIDSNNILNCSHPYTLELLASVFLINKTNKNYLKQALNHETLEDNQLLVGCVYKSRCSYSEDICFKEEPKLNKLNSNHLIACHCFNKIQNMAN